MSKALSSMKPEEKSKAIARRLQQTVKGLGYWAAKDAQKKVSKSSK
jgi:hypothetical protein